MDQTQPRTPSSIVGEILHLTLGTLNGHRILDLANELETAARAEALTEAAEVVAAMIPTLQREWPDEPSDSPWARGVQAAERELRALLAPTTPEG